MGSTAHFFRWLEFFSLNWKRLLLMMILFALALAFFVGSIPFGVYVAQSQGINIREVGSGNIGATNVWRALGPKWGTISFGLDVAKGVAGPLLAHALLPKNEWGIAACGIFAVLGHTFSPFLGFKGGKGIATSLGALFGLIPLVGLVIFLIWGIALFFSRMVSAASMFVCILLPFLAFFMAAPLPSVVVAGLMGSVAFIKHWPNLKRILAGTEPRIGAKKAVNP